MKFGYLRETSELAAKAGVDKSFGYTLIRIPYFIQLTNSVVKQLFNVDCKCKLFPECIPSLNIESFNTPAYLCFAGIQRMAKEFTLFDDQYKTNINYLKSLSNEYLTGVSLLEYEYNKYNNKGIKNL